MPDCRIAIQPSPAPDENFGATWKQLLQQRHVEVKDVDLRRSDWLDQIADCQGVMWRFFHSPTDCQVAKRILTVVEQYLNKPVFPNYHSRWHYEDKVAQKYLFEALDIPTVKTWVFWYREEALQWASETEYPVVFKLSTGAASSNVRLIRTQRDAERLIHRMFGPGIFPGFIDEEHERWESLPNLPRRLAREAYRSLRLQHELPPLRHPAIATPFWNLERRYCYFQEFIPDNEFDIRVVVVADRAWAMRRFNRKNDFRASGSGQLDPTPENIPLHAIELCFEASEKASLQCGVFDVLLKDGQPVIVEVSYAFPQSIKNSETGEAYTNSGKKFRGHWQRGAGWKDKDYLIELAQVEQFIDCIH